MHKQTESHGNKWFDVADVQDFESQVMSIAEHNGTFTECLAKLDSDTAMVVTTMYQGKKDAEPQKRVFAPVLFQNVEYIREINPETEKPFGLQPVGEFLGMHENKAGVWRFSGIDLDRRLEIPADDVEQDSPYHCLRQQTVPAVSRVMASKGKNTMLKIGRVATSKVITNQNLV